MVEDWRHILTHRGLHVNLKCVLSDMLFDLERSHRFRRQRHNTAKLVPMVLTLINHEGNVMSTAPRNATFNVGGLPISITSSFNEGFRERASAVGDLQEE